LPIFDVIFQKKETYLVLELKNRIAEPILTFLPLYTYIVLQAVYFKCLCSFHMHAYYCVFSL